MPNVYGNLIDWGQFNLPDTVLTQDEAIAKLNAMPVPGVGQSDSRSYAGPAVDTPANLEQMKYTAAINRDIIFPQHANYANYYNQLVDNYNKYNQEAQDKIAVMTGQAPESFAAQDASGPALSWLGLGTSQEGAVMIPPQYMKAPEYKPLQAVQKPLAMPRPDYLKYSVSRSRSRSRPPLPRLQPRAPQGPAPQLPKLSLPDPNQTNQTGNYALGLYGTQLGADAIRYDVKNITGNKNLYEGFKRGVFVDPRLGQSRWRGNWTYNIYDRRGNRTDLTVSGDPLLALMKAVKAQGAQNPRRAFGLALKDNYDDNAKVLKLTGSDVLIAADGTKTLTTAMKAGLADAYSKVAQMVHEMLGKNTAASSALLANIKAGANGGQYYQNISQAELQNLAERTLAKWVVDNMLFYNGRSLFPYGK